MLDKEEIAEEGNHEALIELKGNYYHLVKNQLELDNWKYFLARNRYKWWESLNGAEQKVINGGEIKCPEIDGDCFNGSFCCNTQGLHIYELVDYTD